VRDPVHDEALAAGSQRVGSGFGIGRAEIGEDAGDPAGHQAVPARDGVPDLRVVPRLAGNEIRTTVLRSNCWKPGTINVFTYEPVDDGHCRLRIRYRRVFAGASVLLYPVLRPTITRLVARSFQGAHYDKL
jgi:hypothetical protein